MKFILWWYLRIVWGSIIFFFAPLGVLIIVGLPIYDHFYPNERVLSLLQEGDQRGLRVLIGRRDHRVYAHGFVVERDLRETYLFLPSFFVTLDAYQYLEPNGENEGLRRLPKGGLTYLVFFFVSWIIFFKYSVPRAWRFFKNGDW